MEEPESGIGQVLSVTGAQAPVVAPGGLEEIVGASETSENMPGRTAD